MSELDLNAVTAFVAVVEHRSFRAAARSLGVPKSTVSRRVALLEEQLGVQLLQRTTRTVSLTDVGDAFHQRCSQALGTISDAAREVRQSEASPKGVLRVTAPITFAEHFLGDIVTEFLSENPDVRVTLDLTDRYVDLVAEGYDVALRAGPLADSTLKARLLGSNPLVMVASPKYLSRYGAPKTPADLLEHDCILYSNTERGAKWPLLVKRKVTPCPVRARVAVNSFMLARDLAAAGLGIARMPGGFSAALEAEGTLKRVLTEFEVPPSPLHAVFPPGPHLAPRVRAFVDLLASKLDAGMTVPAKRRA
ncbi:MAG: LysR family transcriptional regulator [Myxococcales bacterium]|nr:LysR family transcriptional regulator [Myxococcales bacterium]MDP3503297.1 LysR family transcriptional regulator [Myxococcales bacterium]